ncbi:MAG: hypothetical protein R2942_14255 [Ignavibacteria bacterium]
MFSTGQRLALSMMKEPRISSRTSLFYSGNNVFDTLYFGGADGMVSTIEYGQPWIGQWLIYRGDL